MFIGHYALAFASKRAAPKTSLGVLFAAAQGPDLLWPIFLLLGIEHVEPGGRAFTALHFTSFPWSHSLAMVIVWSFVGAALYAAWSKRDWRGALVVGLLVLSHWILDYATHLPDLPLYPGASARVGLGLWNSTAATVIIEGAMFVIGLWLYISATRARDRVGSLALWGLVALLLLAYSSNLFAPPPQNMKAVAWSALALWLVAFWGAWIDRHREWQPQTRTA